MTPSTPPSIRRATTDDADAVAEVFIAARETMSFLPRLHTDAEAHEFVAFFIARAETWIAVRDNEGLGLACIDGDFLVHLYVHPAYQNAGVGAALLDHVKKCRPHGFQLWTFQANVGARRFYERHDCTLVRLTDGSGNEERLPDALYSWFDELEVR